MGQVAAENMTRVLRFGTAAPTAGTWAVGDTIFNSAPASGDPFGWRCTTAGTPGTWEALASGSAPAVTVSAVYKTADTTYNNVGTLADDPHLSLAVAASGVYIVEAYLTYESATTADLLLGWSAPSGSSLVWSPGGLGFNATASTSATGRGRLNLAQSTILGGVGAGTIVEARPIGQLTVGGTAGTLKARMAQSTAEVSDTIIRSSWLRLSKIA